MEFQGIELEEVTECQHSSAIWEFGRVKRWEFVKDLPAPWVMMGLRVSGDGHDNLGIIYLRAVKLRNP